MKRCAFFNKMLPIKEDFDEADITKAESIKTRATDIFSWGIIKSNAYSANMNLPASPLNPEPLLPYDNLEFPIIFDPYTGIVSVGSGSGSGVPLTKGGIAENLDGERIIISDDAVFGSTSNPPYGLKSSGNLNIPLSSGLTTYYIWIEYLAINTLASRNDEDGVTHYPYIDDGYQIIVTTTATAPSGDGYSIFLAKIAWVGVTPSSAPITVDTGTATTVTDTLGNSVSIAATDICRVYRSVRDNQIEIFVDPGSLPATPAPETYGRGFRGNLRHHIMAIGSGTPTPTNAHGLTLADLPGGTAETKAVQNQKESLAKGIVDHNIPQNSPVDQSTVLRPTIEVTSLIPAATLDPQAIAVGVTTENNDAWVRIKDLHQAVADLTKAIYLGGRRVVRLYPSVRETQDHLADGSIISGDSNSGDGWIGFNSSSDASGLYRLEGINAVIDNQEVLIIYKQSLTTPASSVFPNPLPVLGEDVMQLGYVYWDVTGAQLYRDYLMAQTPGASDNLPVDLRSAGLVGPQEISTQAKSDADSGMLSRVVPINLLRNSNFAFTKDPADGTKFSHWGLASDDAYLPHTEVVQALSTNPADVLLMTGGPGSVCGVKITPVLGQNGTGNLCGMLANLKPDTYYGISFWYRCPMTWATRLRMGINDSVLGSGNSMITTGSPLGSPVDVTLRNDNLWHRGSLVVKTNSSVDSTVQYYFHLQFDNPTLKTPPTASGATIAMTNFCVTEGEWVPGWIDDCYKQLNFTGTATSNVYHTTDGSFGVDELTIFSKDIVAGVNKLHFSARAFGLYGLSVASRMNCHFRLYIDGVLMSYCTLYIRNDTGASIGSPLFFQISDIFKLLPGEHTVTVALNAHRTLGNVDIGIGDVDSLGMPTLQIFEV